MSELEELYYSYWTAFHQFLATNNSMLNMQKPSKKFSSSMSIGRGCRLAAVASKQAQTIRTELVLETETANDFFKQLFEQKAQIQFDLGFPLLWDGKSDKTDAVITVLLSDVDPTNEADWVQQFGWYMNTLEAMHRVFHNRVEALILS